MNSNGNGSVVSFVSPIKSVTQDELIRERVAFQKALRAYEEWQEKYFAIQTAVERGASIEDGIWKARIVEQTVESHMNGFPIRVKKLVVR
jgi:hypothetical protein